MALDFEYCECGCKCYTASSKGITYHVYWNLQNKNGFKLWRGMPFYGRQIGTTYNSLKEAEQAAQKDWESIP